MLTKYGLVGNSYFCTKDRLVLMSLDCHNLSKSNLAEV